MACSSLITYARECGKNAKAGVNSDVYLVAFSDLITVSGSDVYTTATASGLVNAIGVTASHKFVKYGSVINQAAIKEDYTYNDNGSYDIVKELSFSLSNLGSTDGYSAVDSLIANPVAALVKLKSGTWVAFGLNGQFSLKTSAGTVDSGSNTRVITLSGSDETFLQAVDPTIISSIIS